MQYPATPQSVIEWNAKVRRMRRERIQGYLREGVARPAANMLAGIEMPTHAERLEMPAQVRADYAAYVAEWNRVAAARKRAAQAKVNARETAKVRAQACPRCYSTHAGEC